MSGRVVLVRALYDYNRNHTDELSFKKGDFLSVTQQVGGGWWQGSLNGVVGWFPSNYVIGEDGEKQLSQQPTVSNQCRPNLYEFQEEIVQHILEGEIRQINELSQLISTSLVYLEAFTHLPFLTKLSHMKQILLQAIALHQNLAVGLDGMKKSDEPKRVGALFLEVAPTVNAIGCDYSKVHLYIVTGLDKNADSIERNSSGSINFQIPRCKQQLSLLFDRLGRYPLLLKEMERYLENPHVDREDILKAMHIYGEITERCAILRKFKEYDIEILLSTIVGWQGKAIDQLGDPILTLRVMLTAIEPIATCSSSPSQLTSGSHEQPLPVIHAGGQLSVVVIFPTCILLLTCTKKSDTFEFLIKLPLNYLDVVGCSESETDLDVVVIPPSPEKGQICACRLSISCTDQNARDLLVSTLTDLIHYQTQLNQHRQQQQTDSFSGSRPATCWNENQQQQFGSCVSSISTVKTSQIQERGGEPAPITAAAAAQRIIQPLSSSVMNASCMTTATGTSEATSTSVPSSLSIRFLSHRITTNAHVRIFDSERKENNEPPLPSGTLRCLRLDGPSNIHYSNLLHARSPAAFSSKSDITALQQQQKQQQPSPARHRPHSPKNESAKELRRKKSDRQKSAVNADEVLRSVGKLHDQELRTADAALELQVVEAYCASAWNQLGCQSLTSGQSKNRHSNTAGTLSPTESKTLLQTISTPPSKSSHFDASHDSKLKHSCSAAVSSSSGARQVIPRRVHSRGAHDAIHVENPTPTSQDPISYSQVRSTDSSVVQAISPPPVILPSRSGRRTGVN